MIQWGDGVCDARLNTEACNFDGGESGNVRDVQEISEHCMKVAREVRHDVSTIGSAVSHG